MNVAQVAWESSSLALEAATSLANVWIQSGLILLLALASACFLARFGAAVQTTTLRAALVMIFVCPLASWLLESAGVDGVRIWLPRVPAAGSEYEPRSTRPTSSVTHGPPPLAKSPIESPAMGPTPYRAGDAPTSVDSLPITSQRTTRTRPATAAAVPIWNHERFLGMLLINFVSICLATSMLLLLRILVANLLVYGRLRRSLPADEQTVRITRTLADLVGVHPPHVRISSGLSSPCLMGIVHPTIVLPLEQQHVSSDVLLHELAHLRRRDCFWLLLSRLATSVLWFQPLVWWLSRRLEQLADDVADDVVVHLGTERRGYARQLVNIADRYRTDWPVSCVGAGIVSFRSHLGRRVVRILDTSRTLSTQTGRVAILLIAWLAVVFTFAIGLVETAQVGAAVGSERSATSEAESGEEPNKTNGGSSAIRNSAVAATAAPAAEEFEVGGTVVHANGKPAANVGIYLPVALRSPPRQPGDVDVKLLTRTDTNGHFATTVSFTAFPPTMRSVPLIAYQNEHGLTWVHLKRESIPKHVELALKRPGAIRGRVLDTEGQPVVGGQIWVTGLIDGENGALDRFLQAWKNDWNTAGMRANRMFALLNRLVGTETDSSGRFEINGIGRDDIVFASIKHPQYAATTFWIVNREGFDGQSLNRHTSTRLRTMSALGQIPQLVGPDLHHVVERGLTIEGTIYVGRRDNPVPQVTVFAGTGYDAGETCVTGSDGTYTLSGLPRRKEQHLMIRVPEGDSDLLNTSIRLSVAETNSLIRRDVELHRGVVVTGQVVDRETGAGVPGNIRFAPLPGNPFFNEPGYDSYRRDRTSANTESDGTFRLVTIPGPGVLMVQANRRLPLGERGVNPYRQAVFSQSDAEHVKMIEGERRMFFTAENSLESLSIQNAVTYLDLKPGEATGGVRLWLDPGKVTKIHIRDVKGESISGVFVAGLTDYWPITHRLAESQGMVYALGPDRPRKVLLLHPQRQLAGSVTLTGEEQGPVTIKLGPTGSIEGRCLDDGAPLGSVSVAVNFSSETARELYRFAEFDRSAYRTDAGGRFKIGSLVPGEPFQLTFRNNQYRAQIPRELRECEKGATRKFGDVALTRLR